MRNFYSHAPRGARRSSWCRRRSDGQFLLTRPSRGATGFQITDPNVWAISTHTPLAGRDTNVREWIIGHGDFYSHAPRGARRDRRCRAEVDHHFYSHAPRGARPSRSRFRSGIHLFLLTRPSRGATNGPIKIRLFRLISTHTPLAGRDKVRKQKKQLFDDFYSHAPRGARLAYLVWQISQI